MRNVSVTPIVSGLSGEGEFSHHVLCVLKLMFDKGPEGGERTQYHGLGTRTFSRVIRDSFQFA